MASEIKPRSTFWAFLLIVFVGWVVLRMVNKYAERLNDTNRSLNEALDTIDQYQKQIDELKLELQELKSIALARDYDNS